MYKTLFAILFSVALIGCNKDFPAPQDDYSIELNVPKGFPSPEIPENNQLTRLRVELGEKLFFDPSLSRDLSISCATCHIPEKAFADNRKVSVGIKGRTGSRNVPSLINIAYKEMLNADGGVRSLEAQALVPIMEHTEMDFSLEEITERLKGHPIYNELSRKSYGSALNPSVLIRALASYQRTLISANSKFDQFYYHDRKVFTNEEELGFTLFKLHCQSCHSGYNFTNYAFESNGIYEHYSDAGRAGITSEQSDEGKFMVPSLRNVSITYPYMHDGSFENLFQVIEHYNSGGKNNLNKSDKIKPLNLSEEEKEALVKFLHTLTNNDFIK